MMHDGVGSEKVGVAWEIWKGGVCWKGLGVQEWEWPGSAGVAVAWECRSGSGLVVLEVSKCRVCWTSIYINTCF